jgi:hypothetical protein
MAVSASLTTSWVERGGTSPPLSLYWWLSLLPQEVFACSSTPCPLTLYWETELSRWGAEVLCWKKESLLHSLVYQLRSLYFSLSRLLLLLEFLFPFHESVQNIFFSVTHTICKAVDRHSCSWRTATAEQCSFLWSQPPLSLDRGFVPFMCLSPPRSSNLHLAHSDTASKWLPDTLDCM